MQARTERTSQREGPFVLIRRGARAFDKAHRPGVSGGLVERRRQINRHPRQRRINDHFTGLAANVDGTAPGSTAGHGGEHRVAQPGGDAGHGEITLGGDGHAAVGPGATVDRKRATQSLTAHIAKLDAALVKAQHTVDPGHLRQVVINLDLVVEKLEGTGQARFLAFADRQIEGERQSAAPFRLHALGKAVDIAIDRALVDEIEEVGGCALGHAGQLHHHRTGIEITNP